MTQWYKDIVCRTVHRNSHLKKSVKTFEGPDTLFHKDDLEACSQFVY